MQLCFWHQIVCAAWSCSGRDRVYRHVLPAYPRLRKSGTGAAMTPEAQEFFKRAGRPLDYPHVLPLPDEDSETPFDCDKYRPDLAAWQKRDPERRKQSRRNFLAVVGVFAVWAALLFLQVLLLSEIMAWVSWALDWAPVMGLAGFFFWAFVQAYFPRQRSWP